MLFHVALEGLLSGQLVAVQVEMGQGSGSELAQLGRDSARELIVLQVEIEATVSESLSSLRFFELPGPSSAASPSAGGEPAPSPARRARIRSCTSAERNTEPYSDHPRAASDALSAWDAISAQRAWCTAVAEGLLPPVVGKRAERASMAACGV